MSAAWGPISRARMAAFPTGLVRVAGFFEFVDVGFEVCIGADAVLLDDLAVLQVRLTVGDALAIARSAILHLRFSINQSIRLSLFIVLISELIF